MEKIISWLKNNWKQILLVTILVLGLGYVLEIKERENSVKIEEDTTELPAVVENNIFQYKGEEGKDALTLLKGQTTIEQDSTGMVVAINGRKADNTKREFWSFYVNGVQASVGSADYITKNGDIIDWKIENY